LKCRALVQYCKIAGVAGDGGECERLLHSLIVDVMIGTIDSERVREPGLLRKASLGVLHAAAVASRLAREYKKHVFVAVMDEMFTGVVAIANPPGLQEDSSEAVSICAMELSILKTCNTPSVLSLWPGETVKKKVRIFLVSPSELKERAKLLIASRFLE